MRRVAIRQGIDSLIELKHATGFSWSVPERVLRQFGEHCVACGMESASITKEVVDEFLYMSHYRASTVRRNELVIHELGEHLRSLGADAYVCPVATKLPRVYRRPPYVFDDDEVGRFFSAVDSQPISSFTNKSLVDPVLFRVLYGTGVRISEALGITMADVDRETAVLVVRKGKNGRDRMVPLTPLLTDTVAAYEHAAHPSPRPTDFLFYARDASRRMDTSQIYQRFREYLADADIPHFESGPCVHSFRHGFAVANLKRWARAGDDLSSKMPLLCAYMGHSDLRATQYYLRLTADMYPDIVERVQLRFGYVIPERGASNGEE